MARSVRARDAPGSSASHSSFERTRLEVSAVGNRVHFVPGLPSNAGRKRTLAPPSAGANQLLHNALAPLASARMAWSQKGPVAKQGFFLT